MPDLPEETGRIDTAVLDRIASRLRGDDRFETVDVRPPYAPASVVADFDLGYFPNAVERASLRIRWFVTDDFSVHYAEQYSASDDWQVRWDRHPNDHNTRGHVHPPPDADTPGEDRSFERDARDVLSTVLARLDARIRSFWR